MLYLMGPPSLLVDGRPARLDTRKAIAVLARLAVEGQQRREALAELLWPDSDHTRARGALRRTLSTLRSAVGADVLIENGEALQLDRAHVSVDLDMLRAGETTDRDELHRRLDHCRGEFLEGFTLRDAPEFDAWAAVVAEQQRRQLSSLLSALAEAQASDGQFDQAVVTIERRLELDPLQESAYQQLLRVHTWRGDRGAVTDTYLRCVRVLDEELGVPPLQETDELYRQVLSGGMPALPTSPRPQARATTPRPDGLPFVGRDGFLTRLAELRGGRAGPGRLIAVLGTPGVGKSRLLAEAAAATESTGGTVALVRCEESEQNLAYAPVAALLRSLHATSDRLPDEVAHEVSRLLPDLSSKPPASLGSAAARTRFLEALCQAIETLAAGGEGPPVVMFDDLQRADAETQQFVGYLGRRLADRRLLVLAAARPGAGGVTELLAGAADETWDLPPLRLDDVASLVAAAHLTVDANELARDTAGIPYRVVARLTLEGAGDLADGDLSTARLEQADDLGRQVLVAAAVIGRAATPALLRIVSGRSEDEVIDALDGLLAQGLVSEATDPSGEPVYAPVHEELAGAALRGTSLARRRLLHGRVADAMSWGQPPAPAAVLAHHLREAGQESEAALAHATAGLSALDLYANVEAREHLEAALALGHPDSSELLLDLATVGMRLGRYGEAAHHLTVARSRLTDANAIAVCEHRLGELRLREGDAEAARAHLERALSRDVDQDGEVRILADLALAHLGAGSTEDATTVIERALSSADGAARGTRARVANVAGLIARRRGDLDAASTFLAEALEAADDLPEVRIAALNNLARVHLDRNEPAAAVATAREALELGRQLGDRHREAALHNNLADILHAAGQTDEAMELQRSAARLFAGVGVGDGGLAPGVWRLVEW
jgi:DNA-binding SARP family transcriptional activator